MLTPQTLVPKLAKAIVINNDLYLKREDLHPLGSHKGRSIPLMITKYAKNGWRDFVISSSGNAALSAIYAVQEYNKNNQKKLIKLKIFVGDEINVNKINKILKQVKNDKTINVKQTANPKQQAFQFDKDGKAKNLRQSTDNLALVGYFDLAKELAKIKNLSAIFIPTSSGTTAQGLYEGFRKLKMKVQIHVVQTDTCHPFVNVIARTTEGRTSQSRSQFVNVIASEAKQSRSQSTDKRDCHVVPMRIGTPRNDIYDASHSSPSLAGAIVDRVAHRKTQIEKILKTSHGAGWIATNEDILNAIKLVKKTEKINISPNSALSVVGLRQAIEQGWKFDGSVCCVITGQ